MKTKYTEFFTNMLFQEISGNIYPGKIDEDQKKIINNLVSKYYPIIFNSFHSGKKHYIKNLHNPLLAEKFNFTLCNLIIEAIRLVFNENNQSGNVQQMYFESLLKSIGKELVQQDKENSSNFEITDKIICNLNEEYYKLIKNLSDKNFFNTYILNQYERARVYFLQQLKFILDKKREYDNLKINIKCYHHFIFWFSIIALIFSILWNNPENIYSSIINKTILIIIALISLTFPFYTKKLLKVIDDQIKINYNAEFYFKLGSEPIQILVSETIIEEADPQYKNLILPLIANIRFSITDEYGIVTPPIRVMDKKTIKNGYEILLRDKYIIPIDISAEDMVLTENNAKKYNIATDEKYEKHENEFGTFYTLKKENKKDFNEEYHIKGTDYIGEILKKVILKYIHLIFTQEEAAAILQLYRSDNIAGYDIIQERFDLLEIKELFIKLLQKNCSLKDYVYIIEKIIKYSKETKDIDIIAFQIYYDMEKDNFIVK